jgi:hypothetical protein
MLCQMKTREMDSLWTSSCVNWIWGGCMMDTVVLRDGRDSNALWTPQRLEHRFHISCRDNLIHILLASAQRTMAENKECPADSRTVQVRYLKSKSVYMSKYATLCSNWHRTSVCMIHCVLKNEYRQTIVIRDEESMPRIMTMRAVMSSTSSDF